MREIDRYCSYFQGQIEDIRALDKRLFQKILLVAVLDALARARFPEKKFNRDRFIGLIDEFADWPDKSRVSLPQLALDLEKTSLLKTEIDSRIKKEVGVWQMSYDLPCEEVLRIAEGGELNAVEKCRHACLFYTYRNFLVHEIGELGGLEVPDDENPFYLPTYGGKTSPATMTLQFVYPVALFFRIAESSLEGLVGYLRGNAINPFDLYSDGLRWWKG